MKTKKVAVVIKHPFRDLDWRVDITEVPEDMEHDEIQSIIESQMLGPFEVLAISDRINFDRKINSSVL